MTINKKQVNDAKNFEALCAEIAAQEELDSLKLKDEKVYTLLNEYFSKNIYSNFAFIAQTNDKSGALSCLGRLKYFKTVAALCAAVESFKLPESLPNYLLHDFGIKVDYIKNLTAAGGITDESTLAEFEAVVMSLRSLYKEKKRHEDSFQSAGDEIPPREKIKSLSEKPRRKKKAASISLPEKEMPASSGRKTGVKSPEKSKTAATASIDKAEKKRLKKISKEKTTTVFEKITSFIVTVFIIMVVIIYVYSKIRKFDFSDFLLGGSFFLVMYPILHLFKNIFKTC